MFKNNSKYKFIVIEGIDGSGKTTIANALSEQLSCHIYKPPPKVISDCQIPPLSEEITLREFVDKRAFDIPQARFLFYLLGIVQASTEICSLLQTNHVICDRYIASTLVYHQVLDPSIKSVKFDWLNVVSPDYQFLLTIQSPAILANRISERQSKKSDGRLEANTAFLLEVQTHFKQLGLFEISTELNSITDVVTMILGSIKLGH